MVLYYLGLAAAAITSNTINSKNPSMLIDNIQTYFFCEQGGHNASNPCSRSEIENQNHPSLEVISHLMVAIFPLVNLLYAVNIQELKELSRKWFKKYHNSVITKQLTN